MPVVEIQVSSFESPGKLLTTDAIVDSGSDGTFLPEKLLLDLGVESVREAWISDICGII